MLSGPRPSISSTQGRFSDCFIAHSEWPQAGHRRRLTLAHTTQETPEPAHPVDNYRPCWSTTTLVSGHRQSLHFTGLGKSLRLICQQQPRFNYKRRVYSAHTKGAPQKSSLDDRGDYATGPYRTPTTLHTLPRQGVQDLIHRNTGRLPK